MALPKNIVIYLSPTAESAETTEFLDGFTHCLGFLMLLRADAMILRVSLRKPMEKFLFKKGELTLELWARIKREGKRKRRQNPQLL